MAELRLNDYDRTCMRGWRISLSEDVRTVKEADERLLIPEWIRRAQWRHFWTDHDSVYVVSRLTPGAAGRLPLSQRVSDLTDDADWFQSRKVPLDTSEFADVSGFSPPRNEDIRVPVIRIITILVVLVFVAGFFLGTYLSA